MEAGVREIALVLLVALVGVLLAAVVVLAPWHPADAFQVPAEMFVPSPTGQS